MPPTIQVSPNIGSVSATTTAPESPAALIVLAHGAGAGKDHPFMTFLAEELMGLGIATIRFNFPFSENGKKRPDPPAVAENTVRAVIAYARDTFPDLPLFAGGKSFGGRMTSQLLSKGGLSFVEGLVFFGFPLHAPGKPSVERASHLGALTLPLLFLQGTRDALADWSLITQVTGQLSNATLVKFEGADHGFRKGKSYLTKELAAAAGKWMAGN